MKLLAKESKNGLPLTKQKNYLFLMQKCQQLFTIQSLLVNFDGLLQFHIQVVQVHVYYYQYQYVIIQINIDMNNRLSFAQILQKKANQDPRSSRISSNPSRNLSRQGSTYTPPPSSSLTEMMEDYINCPNQPEENFVLSFNQSVDNFEEEPGDLDFSVGINPLDSWIMTQSNLNSQMGQSKNNIIKSKTKPATSDSRKFINSKAQNQPTSLLQLSKKFATAKENKNSNLGNAQNIFKFSSRGYDRSMESSCQQHPDDPRKCAPIAPARQVNAKQMIADTKIIQSQAYGYPQETNRRQEGVPAERVRNMPEPVERKPRYQQTYLDTDRKQEPEILKEMEKHKVVISKQTRQNVPENPENKKPVLKMSKRVSDEDEMLLAGLEENLPKLKIYDDDKKAEEARKQISEIVKTIYKPVAGEIQPKAQRALPEQSRQAEDAPRTYMSPATYSFSQNIEPVSAVQSFAHTKNQLQQIQQEQRAEENERMLSCIEYTQSEADLEDSGVRENYGNFGEGFHRNTELSQSIPEKKQQPERQPSTLQKYLPPVGFDRNSQNFEASQQNFMYKPTIKYNKADAHQIYEDRNIEQIPNKTVEEQSMQFSEVISKTEVQPSINNKQQAPRINTEGDQSSYVMNSDHPKFGESREMFQSIEIPTKETKPVFHDVSSIDIHIPEDSCDLGLQAVQSPSSRPSNAAGNNLNPNSEPMKIPKMNMKISDISSVSNTSHPESFTSPARCTPMLESPAQVGSALKNISQVESHQPQSPCDTAPVEEYGFVYALKMNSRNNSFTSNYRGSVGQSFNQNCTSFNRSNHNSLYIQEQKHEEPAKEEAREPEQELNMNRKKLEGQQYCELKVSVEQLTIPKGVVEEEAIQTSYAVQEVTVTRDPQEEAPLVGKQNVCVLVEIEEEGNVVENQVPEETQKQDRFQPVNKVDPIQQVVEGGDQNLVPISAIEAQILITQEHKEFPLVDCELTSLKQQAYITTEAAEPIALQILSPEPTLNQQAFPNNNELITQQPTPITEYADEQSKIADQQPIDTRPAEIEQQTVTQSPPQEALIVEQLMPQAQVLTDQTTEQRIPSLEEVKASMRSSALGGSLKKDEAFQFDLDF